MDRTSTDRHKADQSEEDVFHSYDEMLDKKALSNEDSKAHTLFQGGKPGRKTLILKLIHSETRENWFQELLLRRSHGLEVKIPKQLVSLDDKYLRRCLEHMHTNVMRGAPCALSVNLGPLDLGFLSDYGTVGRRNSLDRKTCAIDYPMSFGTDELILSPRDEEIVGSIMGSNSMMRILRSPLFQRHGDTNVYENKKCISSDYQGFPARATSSPRKAGKESLVLRNQRYRSDVQRSPISVSSGISLLTHQSYASSPFPSGSQGMLHFTWDNGIPHFTFSLDDQKEVYVATAWKVEVANNKAPDFIYSFHLKASGPNLFDAYEDKPDLIGKMKVSTAFSLSSNSRIMETEFVLVGVNKNHVREMHALSQNNRRSRKFSKVMDVFKSGHSLKQRSPSLVGCSTAICEDFSPEMGSEACCNSYLECKPEISKYDFPPVLELAAIVVKDHLKNEELQKEEVGGWGLKFLKKANTMQQVGSSDAFASSEYYPRNIGDCSTSMDIIVPVGPHGGPSMKNEGPSSLIDRWRSGGNCDCGGWDIGCPLRIFKAKPRGEEVWPSSEARGDYRSFDMFTEGSVHGTPLKMVNIRDGLYFISYQPSSLSALQCFAIAVAIIHSQCPSLRQKHVEGS